LPIFRRTGFNTTGAILDHETQVRKDSVSVCIVWADYVNPYAGGTYVSHSKFQWFSVLRHRTQSVQHGNE